MLYPTKFDRFVIILNWEYAVVYYWFLTESVKNQAKNLIYGFCAFFSIVLLVFGITRILFWRMQRMRWFGWKSWIRRGRRLKRLMGMSLWIGGCFGWGEKGCYIKQTLICEAFVFGLKQKLITFIKTTLLELIFIFLVNLLLSLCLEDLNLWEQYR